MKNIRFYTYFALAVVALAAIVTLAACKKEGVGNPGLGTSVSTSMLIYQNNFFINNQNNIDGIFTAPAPYNTAAFSYSFADTVATEPAYNFTKALDTSFLYFQIIRSNTQVGSVTVTLQDTTNTTIAYQQKINLSDTTSYTLLDGWDTARIDPRTFVRSHIYLARINRAESGAGDPYSPGVVNDFYHWPVILSNTYMVIGRPYNLIVSWIDQDNRQIADTVYRAIQIAN
jgi:hypothetical protein